MRYSSEELMGASRRLQSDLSDLSREASSLESKTSGLKSKMSGLESKIDEILAFIRNIQGPRERPWRHSRPDRSYLWPTFIMTYHPDHMGADSGYDEICANMCDDMAAVAGKLDNDARNEVIKHGNRAAFALGLPGWEAGERWLAIAAAEGREDPEARVARFEAEYLQSLSERFSDPHWRARATLSILTRIDPGQPLEKLAFELSIAEVGALAPPLHAAAPVPEQD